MAGIAQRLKAVLVVSLRSQCRPRWVLTHVPFRLRPDEKSSLQRTATRHHRTQLYEILGSFELFFRKVTYFAKKRGTPCAARHSRFMPEKSRKLELVVDTEKRLVYTVIRLKLENFRKVCYFAKIFMPFFGWKKDAERRPFSRIYKGSCHFVDTGRERSGLSILFCGDSNKKAPRRRSLELLRRGASHRPPLCHNLYL